MGSKGRIQSWTILSIIIKVTAGQNWEISSLVESFRLQKKKRHYFNCISKFYIEKKKSKQLYIVHSPRNAVYIKLGKV